MKKIMNFALNIYGFFYRMGKDRVGIYTAQASFFITLSLFPFFTFVFKRSWYDKFRQKCPYKDYQQLFTGCY